MNVTCPQCATVFRVDPAKVPERGVRARCSVCAALIAVHRPVASPVLPRESAPAIAAPVPMPPPAAVPPPPAFELPPAPMPSPTPRPAPAPAAPPPAPVSVSPAFPSVEFDDTPIPPLSPPSVPFATLPKDSAMPPAPPPPVAPLPPPSGNRFSNPFLQQDPSTRARRLARALVSDLVVYHPEKRQRGLAEGNLKDLFAEEIRKSWEEYTEQVGEDVASTTPYFTEALNEILAEGRALFG
ncbi:MAG: zinc-ribbon domain-containing protein [Gemmatimonadales bacterium]